MRATWLAFIVFGAMLNAQPQVAVNPYVLTMIGRYGVSDEGQFMHYGQIAVQRGRWIPLDVIWVDSGKPGLYRENLVGGGAQIIRRKRFTLTEEAYYTQCTGPKAKGAGYALLWTKAETRITKRLSNDTVWFIYLPLRGNGQARWVIDRARMSWDVTPKIRLGLGFAGSRLVGGGPLQPKPFGNVAYKAKAGTFELWAQHLPTGWGAQVRWARTFSLPSFK